MDPAELREKLEQRRKEERLRQLPSSSAGIDFFSNDYLGIVRRGLLEQAQDPFLAHGSTGSRLLSGNHPLAEQTEAQIAAFHNSPAALIFTSGFDANLGLIASVAGRQDTILFDELSHASLRDGIRLSNARNFSFAHNDVNALERLLQKNPGNRYVITESLFSMDGDAAPLQAIADCCVRHKAYLIVDEAHATGVIGPSGAGLVQLLGLEEKCFARVHTFGKALGCHGAVVLGSADLRDYLINFCRSFIYTTALPPTSLAAIAASYRIFPAMEKEREQLQQLIRQFDPQHVPTATAGTSGHPLPMPASPIRALIVPGNARVAATARALRGKGIDVYPIFSPTVKAGSERLRIILHAFNTSTEISRLKEELKNLQVTLPSIGG